MKQPFDNAGGKPTQTPDGLSTTNSNKADSVAQRKAFGGVRIPRGVYRFKTHEEADEWMTKMLARSEKSKT